ncbi:MAG: ligase-associated DNA damage response endonuclease PdeM [Pirellulales bacterium]|jgi:DNA ligase-associated metallophosphoesterase
MLVEPRGIAEPPPIELLPGRAAWLPRDGTLLVADLHLGKAASFRHAGLPVPEGSASGDLGRLEKLVQSTAATRLLILGDLFHAATGCTPAVFQEFADFRQRIAGTRLVLVEGNHDRRVRLPASLGIDQLVDRLEEPPWVFMHEPPQNRVSERVSVCGHLHPRIAIRSPSGDRLSQRCFVEEPGIWVLPAFGSFTGSSVVPMTATTRVWVAGDDAVIDVSRMAMLANRRRR